MTRDWWRGWRGRIYRRLRPFSPQWFRKKLAGYERRWDLEQKGFTKEGFFGILRKRVLAGVQPGVFLELAAGDGRVGSLGLWLEELNAGWKPMAWEHRKEVADNFARHRPGIPVSRRRLTLWSDPERRLNPVGATTRGSREASALCREIRGGRIRPALVGIWNPSRRPVWYHRLRKAGYPLACVWQNMEFYVDGRRGTGIGSQGSGDGGQRTETRRRMTDD